NGMNKIHQYIDEDYCYFLMVGKKCTKITKTKDFIHFDDYLLLRPIEQPKSFYIDGDKIVLCYNREKWIVINKKTKKTRVVGEDEEIVTTYNQVYKINGKNYISTETRNYVCSWSENDIPCCKIISKIPKQSYLVKCDDISYSGIIGKHSV